MFSVIFEVQPEEEQWEAYLDTAKMLRPELETIDGFVDNIRYASLTRPGWLLSLSGWRDEKAVVRWRTRMRHHLAQEKGRGEILRDYHLRVGEVFANTHVPPGHLIRTQRLDETEVGEGTTITLIAATQPADRVEAARPKEIAAALGLDASAKGLVAWDVLDAVQTPGDVILMMVWRTRADAVVAASADGARTRHVRVVRDYGMFDRREAPQFYPEVARPIRLDGDGAGEACRGAGVAGRVGPETGGAR